MTEIIIVATAVWIAWAVFVWMLCDISSIADDAAYRLIQFQEGIENGTRIDGDR